ncbi:DUF1415 domain-containing protein [Neolewinella aurantiaca]|uniref:DUF1415 domain-containing protein n=1 Tax=Neolewinella aurantiaca TaxID=2602767 RepID=A0A5C7FNY2_9BACT|nr:DUF1415 domain-containing protein [Neolewinella aurantiaca]TXF88115.1 DUF1415 domain-containing protein [Neolewinella aurantiaca]
MRPTAETLDWVKDFVIRHALCPFAALPFNEGRVGAKEIKSNDFEEAFYAALAQVQSLLDKEPDTLETSLLVFPGELLADFETFLDFVYTFEDALANSGAIELVQLAHFHPDYCFEGVAQDDPGNLTNRAPYPVLQLLRTGSVADAVAAYPDVDAIPERNVARMRELFGEQP